MIINKELIIKIIEEQVNEEWNLDKIKGGDERYSFLFELSSKILTAEYLRKALKIYTLSL